MAPHSQSVETVPDPPHWSELFRDIFCRGLAGVLAGVVFLGIGSRLAMRVVTLLNPSARGTLTDAEQIVGAVTLSGTAVLVVVLGAGGGAFAGVIWVVVRERLPESLALRIVLAGVISTLVGSFAIIESTNSDFTLFDPAVLNVAMFMLLIGLCGSATAYGNWVLHRRLPTGARAGITYGLLVGAAAILAVQIIVPAFFVSGNFVDNPPRVAGGFFLVASIGALLSWTRYAPWPVPIPPRTGTWIGTFGLAGMLVFGALHLVGELTEIFS